VEVYNAYSRFTGTPGCSFWAQQPGAFRVGVSRCMYHV